MGIEKNIFEVILEDGKEVARNFVKKVRVKEPVKQVVALGTHNSVSCWNFVRFQSYTMTATAIHIQESTATGIWPSVGIVAVNPRVIPLEQGYM